MDRQRFWNVDLIELFRQWADDMAVFFMTALMFLALSMPVVVPALIMWFLTAINWTSAS